MPFIQETTVLAANARANPLQGNQYEFLPFDAMVEFAVKAIAASAAEGTIFSGSDILMQNATLDGLALATPFTYPEDFTVSDIAAAGERLNVQIRDISGAGTTVRTQVRITPL